MSKNEFATTVEPTGFEGFEEHADRPWIDYEFTTTDIHIVKELAMIRRMCQWDKFEFEWNHEFGHLPDRDIDEAANLI